MAQDDYIRTALRVPPELHAQIHEAAKAADRTFNAEILSRLQMSFAAAPIAEAALMREMRRTQLLVQRSELRSQLNTLWAEGREKVRDLKPKADAGDQTAIEEIRKITKTVSLKKGHLEASMARIDGQLVEIARISEEAGE